jgi:hypothetical protein
MAVTALILAKNVFDPQLFREQLIDFRENLKKSAVANTKSQTKGRTERRGLHISLFSYFVKDASTLNLLLLHNTDL